MQDIASTFPAVDLGVHHKAKGVSDRVAYGFTKVLRFCADTFFAKRYGHRAVVLETVAAVPGMVGATLTHLRCLRRMSDDNGWIRTLMEEAENERMHLMTFINIAKPTLFERIVILSVQWVFYLAFSALYLVSARTAHRVVGYFEEEAVISYTHYLQELDDGRSPNVPAPEIARHYWKLPDHATLRDVILVVRADEAHHRDVNHGFASELAGLRACRRASGGSPPTPSTPSNSARSPEMLTPYRSTQVFDEKSLPAALRGEHRTKAGVWGVIQVIEGKLRFSLANGEGEAILTPDNPGLILPEQPHWVEPIGAMQMQVHFYNQRPDDFRTPTVGCIQ